jgi:molecular chaperone HtpG
MATLVSLRAPEPQWSKHNEQIFVGKDVLELLSSSMYVDPLSMYREYIQNSADAYDEEASKKPARDLGFVQIKVDRQKRDILITDNGTGLSEQDFYRRLTSIGGSSKRGTDARGFRGVGRLAGLGYCQELIFRTRQTGKDTVYELRWDSRKVRSLLRSHETGLDLAGVIGESVERRTLSSAGFAPHFFEVELRNVIRHRDDRLLNTVDISRYLSQVAPVPFHPGFTFGNDIRKFLDSNGVQLTHLQIEVEGEGTVYRPHRNEFNIGTKSLQVAGLETSTTLDRDGNVAAVSWVLHHEYLGSIPRNTLVNGWRIRSGDIQVGDNDILEDLFPETRFNGWTIAETHVVDKKIVPNGRRDNFEQSAHLSDLLTRLMPTAKDIAHRCRTSSISRNALQRLELDLLKCEESLTIGSKKRTPAFVVESVREEVTQRLTSISKAIQYCILSEDALAEVRLRTKRITSRLEGLPLSPDTGDALMDFPPAQRQLLKSIIETIHRIQKTPESADLLIGAILKRARAQRKRS